MNNHLINLWAALVIVSFGTRIVPLFAGNFLQNKQWLSKITYKLPYMILILLILQEIDKPASSEIDQINLYCTIGGIFTTFLVHRWKRTLILSVAVGMITYNLINWLITM